MRIKFVPICLLAVAIGPPAQAWDHVFNDYGNGQTLSAATTYDRTNQATLTIGCLIGSGIMHIQLLTTAPGTSSLPTTVSVKAGGPVDYWFPATQGNAEGHFIASADSATAPIGDISRSIYANAATVEVGINTDSWEFDGADYSDAFGAMLDSCA